MQWSTKGVAAFGVALCAAAAIGWGANHAVAADTPGASEQATINMLRAHVASLDKRVAVLEKLNHVNTPLGDPWDAK
jgi:hypothetical protein